MTDEILGIVMMRCRNVLNIATKDKHIERIQFDQFYTDEFDSCKPQIDDDAIIRI